MDDTEAVAAEAAVAPDPVEALVERWWADHFPGSVLGQHTEIWNYVFGAVGELKRRLKRQPDQMGSN
jgi:hypothetical protein